MTTSIQSSMEHEPWKKRKLVAQRALFGSVLSAPSVFGSSFDPAPSAVREITEQSRAALSVWITQVSLPLFRSR